MSAATLTSWNPRTGDSVPGPPETDPAEVTGCETLDEALTLLARLQPSLAASVWGDGTGADPDVPVVVVGLASQVGRVIVDGWPTGVACCEAMQPGGPWPATSRPEATSVGAASLTRWIRPVAFHNVPCLALPPALQDGDPWGVQRSVA